MKKIFASEASLLVRGFLLPVLIIWAVYFGFLTKHFQDIFLFSASSEYLNRFFKEDFARLYPPIDLVVLGDSTSRSAVNPTDFKDLFAVNLGVNGGTALSAYYVMERYVRANPKPRCLLYLSQYNWKRNYGDFFHKAIFYGNLNWDNFQRAWEVGAENGVFPATEYTYPEYVIKALRTDLLVDELPLNLIQEFVTGRYPRKARKAKMMKRSAIKNRGFQDNAIKRVLPEERFFNEMHAAFLRPFQAYPSEDFYLRRLAEFAKANGIQFFYAMLPVAQSDYVEDAAEHLKQRNAHLETVLNSIDGVHQIPLPVTLSRSYFFDFTHMVREGADQVRPLLDPYLKKACVGDKN